MANIILTFALLVVVFHIVQSVGGPSVSTAWTSWKAKHGKQYSTAEEELVRKNTWVKNQQLIEEHNLAYDEGKRSFKMEMNAFGDQVPSKFRNRKDLKRPPAEKKRRSSLSSSLSDLPPSWDWRNESMVNDVKDQGEHDSSVGFAIADAVASFSAIFKRTAVFNLAVQEAIDCCAFYHYFVDPDVFECITDHGGLCLNGTYKSGPTKVCNNASCKAVAYSGVGYEVDTDNEDDLALAVFNTPVVVLVDGSRTSFLFYKSGVYSDPYCSSYHLDHALLVVGYGETETGSQYWICKNSWGKFWGAGGYIFIARNKYNMCGIATSAIYPFSHRP